MFSDKLTKNDVKKCSRLYRPFQSFCFFMKFCVAQTFWVERHLDVVLEVLQVDGSKKKSRLVDIYHRKIH